jgi:hypothetical protein
MYVCKAYKPKPMISLLFFLKLHWLKVKVRKFLRFFTYGFAWNKNQTVVPLCYRKNGDTSTGVLPKQTRSIKRCCGRHTKKVKAIKKILASFQRILPREARL